MKNVSILAILVLFATSCVQSKYNDLNAQVVSSSDHALSAKYNNKNCIQQEQKQQAKRNQIAVVTE